MTEPCIPAPVPPVHPSKASMPVWKQFGLVTISLCVGGIAGALLAAAPTMFVTHVPFADAPYTNFGLILMFGPINLMLFGAFAAIVTIPSSLAFGVPAFFLLKRYRMLNVLSVALIGAIAGILVPFVIFHRLNFPNVQWWYLSLVGSGSAIVAFLVMTRLGVTRANPHL